MYQFGGGGENEANTPSLVAAVLPASSSARDTKLFSGGLRERGLQELENLDTEWGMNILASADSTSISFFSGRGWSASSCSLAESRSVRASTTGPKKVLRRLARLRLETLARTLLAMMLVYEVREGRGVKKSKRGGVKSNRRFQGPQWFFLSQFFFYRDRPIFSHPTSSLALLLAPSQCASLGTKQGLGDEKIEMYMRRLYIPDPVALHSA